MNQKEITLTVHQAYNAMFRFLEKEYEQTQSDDIGALLGSMSLLEDGSPADPAVKDEWSEAVALALEGSVHTTLNLDSK